VSQLATVRRHHVVNTYLVTALTAGDDARCWSEIAIFTYPTCIQCPHLGSSRQNIVMTYGREKLEWCGYPIVKKIEEMFIRFDRIHERHDRRRDRNAIIIIIIINVTVGQTDTA